MAKSNEIVQALALNAMTTGGARRHSGRRQKYKHKVNSQVSKLKISDSLTFVYCRETDNKGVQIRWHDRYVSRMNHYSEHIYVELLLKILKYTYIALCSLLQLFRAMKDYPVSLQTSSSQMHKLVSNKGCPRETVPCIVHR